MKRILLFSTCLLALCRVGSAQEATDYQNWMKAIGAISGSLHKNLDAKNGNGASADAAKLEELFGKVHEYWLTKSPDAMKFAMDSQAGYREIAAKASAGNFTEALATFKTVSANCGGCHAAHREKAADGTWKIK